MTIATDLTAAAALLTADAAIMRAIVQGPATGGASIVTLPTGATVKTLARAASEISGGYLLLTGGILSGNLKAPNFIIGNELTTDAGTLGFTNSNGSAIQLFGSAHAGAGSIEFLTGGTSRWVLQAAGHLVPKAAGTYKIGAPTAHVLDLWSQNYRIGAEAATSAGTVGFTNSLGPALVFSGNSSAGAGSLSGTVAGVTVFQVLASGFYMAAGGNLGFTSRGALKATADGVFELVNNGVTAQGTLKVKSLLAADATVWPVDTTALAQTIANGATFSFAAGAGLVVLTENTTGQCGLFICGGGTPTLVSQTASIYAAGTPGSGKIGLDYSGGVYRINNNTGSSYVVGIGGMRVRATA